MSQSGRCLTTTHLCVIGDIVLIVRVREADAHWRLQVHHVSNLPRNNGPVRGEDLYAGKPCDKNT